MKYDNARNARQKHIDEILRSRSDKKVVVAGPGTGKTYLFKKVLEGKAKTLTLTFVNSLVEDLSLDLCGISEVRTLHSYARGILKTLTRRDIKVSPFLSRIIADDAQILIDQKIDFDRIFYEMDDENDFLEFYHKRRAYYDHYGYSDIIYTEIGRAHV